MNYFIKVLPEALVKAAAYLRSELCVLFVKLDFRGSKNTEKIFLNKLQCAFQRSFCKKITLFLKHPPWTHSALIMQVLFSLCGFTLSNTCKYFFLF